MTTGRQSGSIPSPGAGTARPAHRERYAAIDALRGGAIVLMVVYHLCWDLHDLGIATFALYDNPFWIGFRSLILILFLGIMGVSLVLAAEGGIDRRRYARRLGLVVVGAAIVTGTSLVLLPESPIWFGVLQFIAVASVLALPFLRLGWLWLAGIAALLWAASFYSDPMFDAPWLRWAGLMTYEPASSDYVPLLPWFAVVLGGMAVGKLLFAGDTAAGAGAGIAAWRGEAWPVRALKFSGRHSLIVYLVHQPVLIGLLYAVLFAAPSLAQYSDGFRQSFLERCQAQCVAEGNRFPPFCAGYCQCALRSIEETVPWRQARGGDIPAGLRPVIDARTRLCLVGK